MTSLLVLTALLLGVPWECNEWSKPIEATEILAEAQRQDGADSIHCLFGDIPAWNRVLSYIDSGDAEWLEVARALLPHADGGAAEELHLALSEALVHSPALTLSVVRGDETPVCGNFEGTRSKREALAHLSSQEEAVLEVEDPSLRDAKRACLAAVARSRTEGIPRAQFPE